MGDDYVGVQSSPLAARARRLLEGVMPEELLAPYVSLLVRERYLLAEARHLFEDGHSVDRLIAEGMAYLQDDGADGRSVLIPASPDLVLQRALARHAEDLAAEHRRLLDGQERLREAHAAQEAAADRSMDQLVQVTGSNPVSPTFPQVRGLLSRRAGLMLLCGPAEAVTSSQKHHRRSAARR